MTYRELLYKAQRLINNNEITLGEYDEMTKPLDEETRKKGKWIKRESITGLERYYECSNCGNHCLYEYVEIGFQNAKTKFCPNCGAEMEGGDGN